MEEGGIIRSSCTVRRVIIRSRESYHDHLVSGISPAAVHGLHPMTSVKMFMLMQFAMGQSIFTSASCHVHLGVSAYARFVLWAPFASSLWPLLQLLWCFKKPEVSEQRSRVHCWPSGVAAISTSCSVAHCHSGMSRLATFHLSATLAFSSLLRTSFSRPPTSRTRDFTE